MEQAALPEHAGSRSVVRVSRPSHRAKARGEQPKPDRAAGRAKQASQPAPRGKT